MSFRRPIVSLALACILASGCATSGYTPDAAPAMSAVEQALPPQYRFFYDALQGYGDWVLIEPYGYVFRPDVNFVAWRPFTEGFWVPTDIYGWVWVSSEPFGWATYHYGEWGYDRYQGWVWLPGLQWAPAWVDWSEGTNFVGWAPHMPSGIDYNAIPGGAYVFVPTNQLPATTVSASVLSADQLGDDAARVRPVRNEAEIDGVVFNRGPSIERIEGVVGPLQRASITDVIPAGSRIPDGRLRPQGREPQAGPALLDVTKRAAREAARDAKQILDAGASRPMQIQVIRPIDPATPPAPRGVPGARKPAARPAQKPAKPAPRDSTGH